MTNGQKIKYIGSGGNYGKTGEFDRYTNAAKTRCRYFLLHENGGMSGYTGVVEDLEKVGAE